jgi:hypothetical protein
MLHALARPPQRSRIAEICDNLTARITEAQREGWLGEVEGLKVSLAEPKTNSPRSTGARTTLGMPTITPNIPAR